jgi:glucose-6-phosphate 1-dehydrogenase
MDEPQSLHADDVRLKRAEILGKLEMIDSLTVAQRAVRASYEDYTKAEGVGAQSETETYFEFVTHIQTETWKGVPFYVRAGKAMLKEKVEVVIEFFDVATGPFETEDCPTVGNTIVLSLSPTQAIDITLNTKKPGSGYGIESQTISYTWKDPTTAQFTAYEKVLYDCICGDQTVFTKTDEVLASWKFITSITDAWHQIPLQTYKKGSSGPEHSLWNNKEPL